MNQKKKNTGSKYILILALVIIAVIGIKAFGKSITVFNRVECSIERKEGTPIVTSTAKLTFTGDIMCHSYQYNEAYDYTTGEYDFSHNFQDMKKYFDEADMVIGNLETVFAGKEVGISDYPCFNSPDGYELEFM